MSSIQNNLDPRYFDSNSHFFNTIDRKRSFVAGVPGAGFHPLARDPKKLQTF